MAITAEDLRRHYQSLPEAALLELNPEELSPVAQGCFREEISRRGLDKDEPEEAPASDEATPGPATAEEMVCIAEYDHADEADLARGLLEASEIQATVESEPGVVRLMVPPAMADQALGLLATPLSDEELAAQAEAAASEEDGNQ